MKGTAPHLITNNQVEEAAKTYKDYLNYWKENEWPEWVARMQMALITGRTSFIDCYMPWVLKTYDLLKSEQENQGVSMADSN